MSLISQNVQSIGNSVDELNTLLKDHPNCQILSVTEHWKTEEQLKAHNITNFELATYYCRGLHQHGGVAIYVKKGTKYRVQLKINKMTKCKVFECVAVECSVLGNIVRVVSVYRPPRGAIDVFYEVLEDLLEQLSVGENTTFIAM